MNAKKIANALLEAKKIVFFHHIKPDGDSLSSSYAMLKTIKRNFPEKEVKWVAHKEFIKERFSYLDIDFKDTIEIDEIDSSYTVVIGDNAVLERIYGYEGFLKGGQKICFDHHRNVINFDHDIYWQQSDLGASSVQAYDIIENMQIKHTSKEGVLALFGILTDTGNFKYSLADPRPLEAAAKLMKSIEDKDLDELYKAMNTQSPKDIAIKAFSLSNYKLEKGIAYLKWTDEDQKKLGVTPADCVRPNLIGNIEGSYAWVLFVEYKNEGNIRTEFRSIGLPVNEVAIKFGGGGHLRASGALIESWDESKQVVKTLQEDLETYRSQ